MNVWDTVNEAYGNNLKISYELVISSFHKLSWKAYVNKMRTAY